VDSLDSVLMLSVPNERIKGSLKEASGTRIPGFPKRDGRSFGGHGAKKTNEPSLGM
jgi:hypothetical protein